MEKKKISKKELIHVLFVDDNLDFLEISRLYLEKINKNYIIHGISHPETALYNLKIGIKRYDAIVSDYSMRGMDGLKLLEEIRKFDQIIPFVILTGQGREEIAIQAIKLGADYYLQKGIELKSMYAELDNFIIKAMEKQKAIIAREKAEQNLDKQVEETKLYLDIITHDLNGYHMAAKTFLEMIELVLPEDTQTVVQKSIKNIVRANTLLNNISVLMQQDEKHRNVELQPINVLMAIERIKKDLFSMFPLRSIIINTSVIKSNIMVYADLLFEQVILNLFTNAVKSDDQNPVRIIIALEVNKRFCLLKIADYGCGIPLEERKSLFTPSTVIARSRKSGMGLGLYIVKSLIDRYKGDIWIEDRILGDYTQGTRFTLKLHVVQ